METRKLMFYSGLALWAAVLITSNAATKTGQWLLIIGLILVMPYISFKIIKYLIVRKLQK